MSKDFSGFDKNVPANKPSTKSQKPVSSWDVDTSPFHRLLESYISTTREITDTFINKLDNLVESLKEGKTNRDTKNFHDKILKSQKSHIKEVSKIQETVENSVEKLSDIQVIIQDMALENKNSIESIKKSIQGLNAPLIAQENLLREGFAPTQIVPPLEKILNIEQESFRKLENLVELHNVFVKKSIENHVGSIADKLDELSRSLLEMKSYFVEKNFLKEYLSVFIQDYNKLSAKSLHDSERTVYILEDVASSLKNLEKMQEQQKDILEKQKELLTLQSSKKNTENIVFWTVIFMALILLGVIISKKIF